MALTEITSKSIKDGEIVNADLHSSASIATSKLSGAVASISSHGLATSATTDTTNAANIGSGTLPAARIGDDSIAEIKLDISNAPSDGQYLQYKDSTDKLTWATVSTDPTTTSGTNNFTIADGDLIIGTAGHGIDFSAQTVTAVTGTTPSQTTEVLDHYEQGTWTPNPDTGTLAAGGGRYVRIGNVVYLNGYVKVSDTSSSNTVLIAGIPYSVGSQGDAGTGWNGSIRGYNLSSNIGDSTEPDNCTIDGSDKLQFGAVTNNGGGWAMLGHNEITNSDHAINFTIWYVTDA